MSCDNLSLILWVKIKKIVGAVKKMYLWPQEMTNTFPCLFVFFRFWSVVHKLVNQLQSRIHAVIIYLLPWKIIFIKSESCFQNGNAIKSEEFLSNYLNWWTSWQPMEDIHQHLRPGSLEWEPLDPGGHNHAPDKTLGSPLMGREDSLLLFLLFYYL